MDTSGILLATDAMHAERAQKQYYADREKQSQVNAYTTCYPAEYQRRREQEIRDRFSYRVPKDRQIPKYQALRSGFGNLAVLITQNTDPARGKTLRFTS